MLVCGERVSLRPRASGFTSLIKSVQTMTLGRDVNLRLQCESITRFKVCACDANMKSFNLSDDDEMTHRFIIVKVYHTCFHN